MNRSIQLLVLGSLVGLVLSGCAGAYTNIEAIGEGQYRITEIKSGAFRLQGVLLKCEGQGTTMKCKEIAIE